MQDLFKMSKYSDSLEQQIKDLKKVKEATKDVIKKGKKLAFEEYYDAKSLDRIKKEINK